MGPPAPPARGPPGFAPPDGRFPPAPRTSFSCSPTADTGDSCTAFAPTPSAAASLHVGRLPPEKNLAVLIAAWRIARARLGEHATFVIAGEGPLERRVVAALPFVRQLGFLPRDRLATLYASSDLCVLPSPTET